MAASVLSAPMASIGVPKEIKLDEERVALTPDAVRELVSQGLEVRIGQGLELEQALPMTPLLAPGPGGEPRRSLASPGGEGEGTPGRGICLPAAGHGAVHLPAPGRLPPSGGPCPGRHHRHYLRNGAAGKRQPAAAGTDGEIAGRLARVGAHLLEKPTAGAAC